MILDLDLDLSVEMWFSRKMSILFVKISHSELVLDFLYPIDASTAEEIPNISNKQCINDFLNLIPITNAVNPYVFPA